MRVVQKSNCPQMTFFFLKICELINPLSVDSAVFNLKKYIKKRVVKKFLSSYTRSQQRATQISLNFVHSFFLFYLCVPGKNQVSNQDRFGDSSIM